MFIIPGIAIRLFELAGSPAGGGSGSGPAPTATSPTPVASTPTPGSAPTPSPSATPAPVAGQPTAQQPTPTPDPDLQDGNWKQLRDRYESAKTELAALKAQSSPQAAAVITHAQSLAKSLGYADQDFADAFAADPIKTLQVLQEEAAQRQPGQTDPKATDLNKQIEDAVSAKLTPIQEFQNRQATEVAMTKYESNLDAAIKADPILKEAPSEIVDIVKDYLGEYFSTQPQILMAMKTKSDFSAINDALTFTVGRLHSGFKAWLAKGQPQTGTLGTGNQPAPRGGRPSLDEIINDPGVLGNQYR